MITQSRTRNSVLIGIGLCLLLASFLVSNQNYPDIHGILREISIITISVSLLDFLYHLAGGNPVEQQITELSTQIKRLSETLDVIENARTLGIIKMHDCTVNYGGRDEWFDVMKDARISMDLMGRSLYEWIRSPEFDDIILDKMALSNFEWVTWHAG